MAPLREVPERDAAVGEGDGELALLKKDDGSAEE